MFYSNRLVRDVRAAPRPRCLSLFARNAAAFTLLELVIVIALIAALTSALIAGAQRASIAATTARARAELAVLSVALEDYRRRYGDYPRTGDAAQFLQSLLGRRTPTGAACVGGALIDLNKFTTANALDPLADATAELVDPWGQPYVYRYRTQQPWMNTSALLYSAGADGRDSATLLVGGFVDSADASNLDNLQAGGLVR